MDDQQRTQAQPGADHCGCHTEMGPEADLCCAPTDAGGEHRRPVRRDRQALLARLRRIEGQVRGISRMIEEDRYCVDVLVQLAAVRAALAKVSLHLLEDHTRGCVAGAIANGTGEAAVQELMDVLDRLVR
jgi:DNA-binding FrmR family transcriptional regulator